MQHESSTMPEISVIIETFNASPDSTIQLRDILQRLREQHQVKRILEVVVVTDAADTRLFDSVLADFPEARKVTVENSTYYSMKFHGVDTARGKIIAFLDSDCLPDENWVSRILTSISEGADAVTGKTRYSRNKGLSRTFGFFSFGHIQNNENGEANTFIPNNAAFLREALFEHSFDPRRRRSCGAYLIASELKARGHRLVYNPAMAVKYHNYGLSYHLWNRVRSAYEAITLCRWDTDDVLPDSRYKGLGILTPLVFAARRVVHDLRCLASNRRDLDIAWYEAPYFALASVVVRSAEIVPGIVTVLKRGYFGKRFGW